MNTFDCGVLMLKVEFYCIYFLNTIINLSKAIEKYITGSQSLIDPVKLKLVIQVHVVMTNIFLD